MKILGPDKRDHCYHIYECFPETDIRITVDPVINRIHVPAVGVIGLSSIEDFINVLRIARDLASGKIELEDND